MAGLCWTAAVLLVFLSAGNTSAAVDQNWLASIIEGIKNEYAPDDTFSLAVNIPQNQDPNNLQQVLQADPADKVKETVSEGQVYRGIRVVAAAQPGAVASVLDNIQPFVTSSQGNFLIIYSEESPCGPTCTTAGNEDGIAAKINDIIQNWSGYVFVFSKVVDVPDADATQLSESFSRLSISKLGLDNIFRCFSRDDAFQCTGCSSGGGVTPSCVANDAPSNQEEGEGEEMSTVQPTDTQEMGVDSGQGMTIVIDGGRGRGRGQGTGGPLSRCKGLGKRRGGCKRRGGGRRGQGGKVRRGRKGRGRKGRGGKGRGGKRRGGKGRGGKRRGGKGRKRGRPRGGRRRKGKRGGKGRRHKI